MQLKEITNKNYNELENGLMSSYLLRKYHHNHSFDDFISDLLNGKSEYRTVRVYDENGIVNNSLDINNDKNMHQYMMDHNLSYASFKFELDYGHEFNNGYPFLVSGTWSAYMGDYDDENEVFASVILNWDKVSVSA